MRRLALVASLAVLAAGCGGGGDGTSASADDIARAATKSTKKGSLEADFAISGQGLTGRGSGVFNTGKTRSGQLQMTVTANGRDTPVDTIVSGDVFYMRSPAFARAVGQGKQWIKLDLGTIAKRGANLGGLLDASPTPTNALAYLEGTTDVKKVGSEKVGGVATTHYTVNADLRRAVERASGTARSSLPGDRANGHPEAAPRRVARPERLHSKGEVRRALGPPAGRPRGDRAARLRGARPDHAAAQRLRSRPAAAAAAGGLMDVALKVWRYDPESGDRVLREYEVDAPEWACLLDVLDLIKDKHDGTLAYRKSCRMMICGSCGMRMDGRAVLACKERMKPIVDAGHVPVISPMGNMPVVKDLVVDMAPFWSKIRAVKPWLDSGYDEVA